MAIGVDSSKWKPRNLRGTPARKFIHLLSAGILAVGIGCGVFLQYSPLLQGVRKKFETLYVDPIEKIERKQIIASSLPTRTGDSIRKLAEEQARFDLPHK